MTDPIADDKARALEETEIWKAVLGYEYRYEVSSLGKVRSLKNDIELRQSQNGKGYNRITLYDGHKGRSASVHRLVLEAFFGKSDLQVDHINGIRNDNRLSNLEYVTGRENVCRGHQRTRKNKDLPSGVHYSDRKIRPYLAIIQKDKVRMRLGRFKTVEEAQAAYLAKLNEFNAANLTTRIAEIIEG